MTPPTAAHRALAQQTLGDIRLLGRCHAGEEVYRYEPPEPLIDAIAHALAEEAAAWRRLLWLWHGCLPHHLEAVDDEIRCGACRVDFGRDALGVIREKLEAAYVARVVMR
jgi:hypothetical protein